jgi:menaquinol-cytochrome c reductase iron-sulfur subunit
MSEMKASQAVEHAPHEDGGVDLQRRNLLKIVGGVGILVSIGGAAFQSFRSMLPNVLNEAPLVVKIGAADQLPEGMTFLEELRLFIFREGKTYHAISANCTHLGCTVKYAKLTQPKTIETAEGRKEINFEFHCPCHGSKYYADGVNYEGPAPTPLKWYKLELSPEDGQIVVDMSAEVDRNYRLTV